MGASSEDHSTPCRHWAGCGRLGLQPVRNSRVELDCDGKSWVRTGQALTVSTHPLSCPPAGGVARSRHRAFVSVSDTEWCWHSAPGLWMQSGWLLTGGFQKTCWKQLFCVWFSGAGCMRPPSPLCSHQKPVLRQGLTERWSAQSQQRVPGAPSHPPFMQ